MWNWVLRLLGVSVIQDDWEISLHQNGLEVVVKRRSYTCDEVIKIIRSVTTFQGMVIKEYHAQGCPYRVMQDNKRNGGKPPCAPNCYIRKGDR